MLCQSCTCLLCRVWCIEDGQAVQCSFGWVQDAGMGVAMQLNEGRSCGLSDVTKVYT